MTSINSSDRNNAPTTPTAIQRGDYNRTLNGPLLLVLGHAASISFPPSYDQSTRRAPPACQSPFRSSCFLADDAARAAITVDCLYRHDGCASA